MVIIGLTLISFLYPFWPQIKRLANRSTTETVIERDPAPDTVVLRDLAGLVVVGAIALVVITQSQSLNQDAAVFPRTIAIGMLGLVGLAIFKLFVARHVTEIAVDGAYVRMIAVPAFMFAAVAPIPLVGFEVSAVLMGLALIVPAQHDAFTTRGWVIQVGGVACTVAIVSLVFGQVLGVPLP